MAASTPNTAKPALQTAPPSWPTMGFRVATAAAAFSLFVAAALVKEHFQHKKATYPLDHPRIISLKEQLVREPLNEGLKSSIRGLDLQFRVAHDRYLQHVSRGRWLLFGGAVVFLAAIQATVWNKKIARPGKVQRPPGWQAREVIISTVAVALMGGAIGAGAWSLAQSSTSLLTAELAVPPRPVEKVVAAPVPVPVPSAPYPSAEEVAHNWGRFRGPGGAGVSVYTNIPLTWNLQSGENILWKTKSPGPDFNSPVVWDNRLFFTTGTAKKREVFCFDGLTGQLVWQKAVERVPGGSGQVELPEISGGMSCPTAAVDGRRVYVMFANGDVAAFDFGGNLAWAVSLAPIKNQYGHAASLDLWQNRLIIQLDHGDSDSKVSRLVALNTADGKVAWERPRETHGTWSSPITVEAAGKPQIITLGLPHVISYSAVDGAELWRVDGIDGEITPSPVYAGGLVLAPSPSTKLIAIKPAGAGDVTKSHVLWNYEEGVPDITSPVSDGQRVYMLTTGGTFTSVDLKTGKKVWDKELELEFKASPSLVGDKLLLFSTKGDAFVVNAAADYKEAARLSVGDEIVASPAFADGRMYLRGRTNLYCIGKAR